MIHIIWSKQAGEALRDTTTYVRKEFGVKAKEKLIDEVLHFVALLAANPQMGIIEPLLESAPVEYRSFVINRLNKAVYWVHDDTIEIVAFWDTRREPEMLAKEVL